MTSQKISKNILGAILASGLLSFAGVVVETAMNITFPTLMKEFSITTATVQWMTTIYLLVVASVVPLSAYLKRSFKMKSLFVSANLLFLLGLIIDIIAPSFGILLFGRVIQGLGVGIALPLMFNIILEQVPIQKIGTMMGIGTLITAIAPAIGPTFGGLVANHLGWRYIFVLLVPILLLSLFLGIKTIQQKSLIKREKLDIISVFAVLLLFIGLILGINNISEHAFFSLNVIGWLIVGLLGLLILVVRSAKAEQPIINLSILKHANFTGHVIPFFILQLISLGLSFLLPNYIQLVNHSTATLAGILVFPGALLGALFAPFGGTLLDMFGARKPIIIGAGLIILATALYWFFGLQLTNTLLCLFYLIYMLGMGTSFGNIMTNGQKQLDRNHRADANAIFNTLQQFAGAVGTTIASLIVALSQASYKGSYSTATAIGSRNAFLLLLILAIVQFCILLKTVKDKTEH
ncbi:DHA2 family efflux MFS transporter permease subunit [Streptococcus dentiloxodontae]